MRSRIFIVAKKMPVFLIPALLILLLYAAGLRIPCFFYTMTGIKCPGCGITRMSIAFLHGDYKKAFYYNQVLPFLLPVIGILFCLPVYRFIRYGEYRYTKIETGIGIGLIVLLLLYAIIRNLPFYPYF